jgi:hypothetical protein
LTFSIISWTLHKNDILFNETGGAETEDASINAEQLRRFEEGSSAKSSYDRRHHRISLDGRRNQQGSQAPAQDRQWQEDEVQQESSSTQQSAIRESKAEKEEVESQNQEQIPRRETGGSE